VVPGNNIVVMDGRLKKKKRVVKFQWPARIVEIYLDGTSKYYLIQNYREKKIRGLIAINNHVVHEPQTKSARGTRSRYFFNVTPREAGKNYSFSHKTGKRGSKDKNSALLELWRSSFIQACRVTPGLPTSAAFHDAFVIYCKWHGVPARGANAGEGAALVSLIVEKCKAERLSAPSKSDVTRLVEELSKEMEQLTPTNSPAKEAAVSVQIPENDVVHALKLLAEDLKTNFGGFVNPPKKSKASTLPFNNIGLQHFVALPTFEAWASTYLESDSVGGIFGFIVKRYPPPLRFFRSQYVTPCFRVASNPTWLAPLLSNIQKLTRTKNLSMRLTEETRPQIPVLRRSLASRCLFTRRLRLPLAKLSWRFFGGSLDPRREGPQSLKRWP